MRLAQLFYRLNPPPISNALLLLPFNLPTLSVMSVLQLGFTISIVLRASNFWNRIRHLPEWVFALVRHGGLFFRIYIIRPISTEDSSFLLRWGSPGRTPPVGDLLRLGLLCAFLFRRMGRLLLDVRLRIPCAPSHSRGRRFRRINLAMDFTRLRRSDILQFVNHLFRHRRD